MAITFVNGNTASSTTSPATTGSIASTFDLGQLVCLTITNDSGTLTSITSVGDSLGNTYLRTQTPVSNSAVVEQWWTQVTVAGASPTANCVWNTGTTGRVTIEGQYFHGFIVGPMLDQVSNAVGTSTTASGGTTSATTVANEVVIQGVAHASTTSAFSLGAGYTNLTTVNVANAAGAQSSKVISSTGAQSGTTTIAASRAWSGMLSTFYDKAQPTMTGVSSITGINTVTF